MRYNLCAVLDAKLAEYGNPFTVRKTGEAIRSFADAVNQVDANNNMNKHPEDFTLWYVGDFDNETGEVINVVPRLLCSASEFIKG